MSRRLIQPIGTRAAVRLALRIMPPHRREWAQAMLNELAYIESRRAAARWIVGSTLCAIRERSTYTLEQTSMHIKPLKTVLVLAAVAVSLVASVYAIQKPYQQERIKFTLQRWLSTKQT